MYENNYKKISIRFIVREKKLYSNLGRLHERTNTEVPVFSKNSFTNALSGKITTYMHNILNY